MATTNHQRQRSLSWSSSGCSSIKPSRWRGRQRTHTESQPLQKSAKLSLRCNSLRQQRLSSVDELQRCFEASSSKRIAFDCSTTPFFAPRSHFHRPPPWPPPILTTTLLIYFAHALYHRPSRDIDWAFPRAFSGFVTVHPTCSPAWTPPDSPEVYRKLRLTGHNDTYPVHHYHLIS